MAVFSKFIQFLYLSVFHERRMCLTCRFCLINFIKALYPLYSNYIFYYCSETRICCMKYLLSKNDSRKSFTKKLLGSM